MNRILARVAGLVLLLCCAVDSQAAIVRLSQSDFTNAAAGREVVEDFEGFTTGTKNNPFVFANARYSSPASPAVVNNANFGPTNRLISQNILQPRTFDLFPQGTTLFGMELFYRNPPDVFDVTVVGGSGTLNFSENGATIGSFLGFHDPAGLISVTIEDLGDPGTTAGAYSFDNVATSVPEPTTYLFLGSVCLLIAYHRRRRVASCDPG